AGSFTTSRRTLARRTISRRRSRKWSPNSARRGRSGTNETLPRSGTAARRKTQPRPTRRRSHSVGPFPHAGRYTVQVRFYQEQGSDVLIGERPFSLAKEGDRARCASVRSPVVCRTEARKVPITSTNSSGDWASTAVASRTPLASPEYL